MTDLNEEILDRLLKPHQYDLVSPWTKSIWMREKFVQEIVDRVKSQREKL